MAYLEFGAGSVWLAGEPVFGSELNKYAMKSSGMPTYGDLLSAPSSPNTGPVPDMAIWSSTIISADWRCVESEYSVEVVTAYAWLGPLGASSLWT